jgi:hypothetical protein
LNRLAAERHADGFARLCLPEDAHGHVALQQHVVADDAGELDVGEGVARQRQERNEA